MEEGKFGSEEFEYLKIILVVAANEAVMKKDDFIKDMQKIFLPFMNDIDKKEFLAGCKFGNKQIIYG